MCLQDEEADGHRAISLCEVLILTSEEFKQRDEIAQALAHFLAVDGNHVVVHPVAHHIIALGSCSLSYLTLMMWENQVHASSVNVEVVAQILTSHSRALAVPTWKTVAPR